MKQLLIIVIIVAQCLVTGRLNSQQTRGLVPVSRGLTDSPQVVIDVDTMPPGATIANANLRIVWGKIYEEINGVKSPAAHRKLVLMPLTMSNLSKAENRRALFDENTVNSIPGARIATTTIDGNYEFNNVMTGVYIIRVVGKGGRVIQFTVPMENYIRRKVPDATANY